jgi:hypothetical protein
MVGFNPNKISSSKTEKIETIPKLDPQELFELAKQEQASVEIKPEDRSPEGRLLASPNGPESNLSEEYWKLVRTPSFKKWFGGSNVVDENSEPALLYHKTHSDLENFNGFSKDNQTRDPAHYFTSGDIRMGKNRLSVFINAKVKEVEKFSEIHRFTDKTMDEIIREGYDGVAYLADNASHELEKTKEEFRKNYAPESLKDHVYFGFNKLKGLLSKDEVSATEESEYIKNKTQFLQTLENPYYQLVVFDGSHVMIVNKEKDYGSQTTS